MKVPKQQRKAEKEEAESKKNGSSSSESEVPAWAVGLLLFVLLGSTVVGIITAIMGGGLN